MNTLQWQTIRTEEKTCLLQTPEQTNVVVFRRVTVSDEH